MLIVVKNFPDYQDDMTDSLKEQINYLVNCPIEDLIKTLRTMYPREWNGSHPNLKNYIPLLNRIDTILEHHIKKYKLNEEKIEPCDVPATTVEVITTCVDYSNQLLEYSKHKEIYNSHQYIADLMFSNNIDIKLSSIKMICCLTENCASHFPMKFSLSQKHKDLLIQFIKTFPPQSLRTLPPPGPTPIEIEGFDTKSKLSQNAQKSNSSISPEHGSEPPTLQSSKKNKKLKAKDSDIIHISLHDCVRSDFNVPPSWTSLNYEYYKVSVNLVKKDQKQPKTKSVKRGHNDDENTEGLRTFKLSSESLKKLSIQQIFDKAAGSIPKEKWTDFVLHVYIAIAYSGKSFECFELRNKLVAFKCYSIAAAASNNTYNVFVGQVFDEEPYLLSYMCDLINPDNKVSRDSCIATLRAFVNISNKKNGGSDLMRALGGNVSHGLLFHILKTVLKQAKELNFKNDQVYMNYIYNILANMLSIKSLAIHLRGAGLMKVLLEFLTLRNDYRMTRSGPLHLIEIFIDKLPDAFDEFVALDGFNVIIGLLEFETQYAIDNPNHEGGAPKDSKLSHTITARQVKLLDFLLRLVLAMITKYPGDRMRNLYDSPMLKSIIKILQHPKLFGHNLIYNCIRVVTTIINSEPTAYSILNESGVIDTFFDDFSSFLLPNTKLLLELPDAINAISLNVAGLAKVKEKDIIPQLFSVFKNVEICKELVVVENVMILGHTIDELARHHPELKDIISEQILSLINTIPQAVTFNSVDFYHSQNGSLYHGIHDEIVHTEIDSAPLERWETCDEATIIQCSLTFLASILESSKDWKRLSSQINMDNLFQFITLKNAPFDYSLSKTIIHFRNIVKAIDQNTRSYCLSFLIEKISKILEELNDFIYFDKDDISFFNQFESSNVSNTEIARRVISNLGIMNCLLFVLSDFYSKLHKYQPNKISDIAEAFGSEKGLKLVNDLCYFFRRLALEETLLHYNSPEQVAKNTFTMVQSISPKQKEIGIPPDGECDWNGNSAKFKNISILYFNFSRSKFWLRNIFNCFCSINWGRRSDTQTLRGMSARCAVAIITEFTNAMFKILTQVDTTVINIKVAYQFSVLNQLHLNQFHSFGAAAPLNPTMSICLLQNENFPKLKTLALEYFMKLTTFDSELLSNTAKQEYISMNLESLVIAIIGEILQIYSDVGGLNTLSTLSHNTLPNSDRLYSYLGSKKSEYSSEVLNSIQVQSSIANFALLQDLISEEGFNLIQNCDKIPESLIRRVIVNSEAAYMKIHAPNAKFKGKLYPIAPENTAPTDYNVKFLLDADSSLTEDNAREILLFYKDDMSKVLRQDVYEFAANFEDRFEFDPERILQKEYIPQKIDSIHSNYSSKYEIHNIDDLYFHRSAEENTFIMNYIKLAELYPGLTGEIAELFNTVFHSRYSDGMVEVVQALYKQIELLDFNSSDIKTGKEISSKISLSNYLLYNLSFEKNQELVKKFTTTIFKNLKTGNPDKPWFDEALTFFSTILRKTKIPFAPEAPKVTHSTPFSAQIISPPSSFTLDSEMEDELYELVLDLQNMKNDDNVTSVTTIILMICVEDHQVTKLSKSNVIRALVQHIKSTGISSIVRSRVLMVLRRSVESKHIVKSYMENKLTHIFNDKFKSKKPKVFQAKNLLEENASLVLRDPSLFCEVISENCAMKIQKHSSSPFLNKITDEEKKVLKDHGIDSEKKRIYPKEDSPAIMSHLLSELMQINRRKLFEVESTSENQPDGANTQDKDGKKAEGINKIVDSNKTLGYTVFLLHSITELLFSYNSCKAEFLTFSKKLKNEDDKKPRSTALNMLLHLFINVNPFDAKDDVEHQIHSLLAALGHSCILGLISTVPSGCPEYIDVKVPDDDAKFARKFTVDILIKMIREIETSNKSTLVKYGKIVDIINLVRKLYGESLGNIITLQTDALVTKNDRYYFAKELIDKKFNNVVSSVLAKLDMNFPYAEEVSENVLKFFSQLGEIKIQYQDAFKSDQQSAEFDEEVFDDDDEDKEKDDAPDLLRNSTLGMYDLDDVEDEDDFEDDFEDEEFLSEEGIEIILSENDHGSDDDMDNEVIDEDDIVEEILDDDMEDEEGSSSENDDGDDSMSSDEYSGHHITDPQIDFYGDSDDEGDDEMMDDQEIEDYVSNAEADFDDMSESGDEISSGESADEDDEESSDVIELALDSVDESGSDTDDDSDDSQILQEWLDELGEDNEGTNHSNNIRSRRSSTLFNDSTSGMSRIFPGMRSNIPLPMEMTSDERTSLLELTNSLRRNNTQIDRLMDFRRVFEPLMFSKRGIQHAVVSIQTTTKRWEDSSSFITFKNVVWRAIPDIINKLSESSLILEEHERNIKEEKERKRKEKREEDRKKREEEQRRLIENALEEAEGHPNEVADNAEALEPSGPTEPIYVEIGGRNVDISGTGIDPEFMLALPDEMRQEVYEQHVSQERIQQASRGALHFIRNATNPLNIRVSNNDVVLQNLVSSNGESRGAERLFGELLRGRLGRGVMEDSDSSSIDEHQPHEISIPFDDDDDEDGDVDEDDDDDDDEDDDAEDGDDDDDFEERLVARSLPMTSFSGGVTEIVDGLEILGSNSESKSKKPSKVHFTALIDKFGVAALLKVLFIPQVYYKRELFFKTVAFICLSKHSRTELIAIILYILQEALKDQNSLAYVYNQICIKANSQQKDSLDTQSPPITSATEKFICPAACTTISLATQCIDVLQYLLENESSMRFHFLTDQEGISFMKKSKKGKLKDNSYKFPINVLLNLLDNKIIKEDTNLMDILSRSIQISTRPLPTMKAKLVQLGKEKPAENTKKLPQLPNIPDKSLKQIINILVADECANKVFQQTIVSIQNLSVLDNAKIVFPKELSKKATHLSCKIVKELRELIKDLKGSKKDIEELASLGQFSSGASDQAKLLRVLTALDYLYQSKDKDATDDIEELKALYKNSALAPLWGALSDCLHLLREDDNMNYIAFILSPLIEALLVVCKHSKVQRMTALDVLKYKEGGILDFAKEPIESLFFSFTEEHKKILNHMIRNNPKLMSGPFQVLIRNPKVLEFDNKRVYFEQKLHGEEPNEAKEKLPITIKRDQVFLDSYRSIFFKPSEKIRKSLLEIHFSGEEGVDAGGVTREWYQVLSRQIFDPNYALFIPLASDKTTFHPNRTSWVNPEHLSFFKFVGMIIGKAVFDGYVLDCHFSRAVFKRLLGKTVSLKDMESIDLDYYKSLVWMLENDITDIIVETFSVETDDYGEQKTIDLIPNGRDIAVTEENKQEYVKSIIEYRLLTSVKEQLDNFLEGFYSMIPKELIAIFDEQELELLVSGLPDIDVNDWKNNTIYENYSPSSPQVQWFWRAVKSFDTEERAKLLQFATGTSKVPLSGFKELTGMNGISKFSIHRVHESSDRLPTAHTCFNQIDLPEYESYAKLRSALLLAIREGHEGFGFA